VIQSKRPEAYGAEARAWFIADPTWRRLDPSAD